MSSMEDQQIGICLLKSNLEEIGHDLVVQRSAIPALEAENKKKCNETKAKLRIVRSLKADIEMLKMENVRLTAKRAQLKRQSNELTESLEEARKNGEELTNVQKQENSELEAQLRRFESSLQERADRFRKILGYYDEAEIQNKIKIVNAATDELEEVKRQKQSFVNELKKRAESIQPDVPESIVEICGKPMLEEKVEALTSEFEALSKKQKTREILFLKP